MIHSFARTVLRVRGFVMIAGLFVLLLVVSPFFAQAAGTLPPEVQKGVDDLLAMQNPSAPLPDKTTLDAFLAYTTSPVNLGDVGGKAPAPGNIGKAAGILWRTKINTPLGTMLEYLYNQDVPVAVVYPASIRNAKWLPGADILKLNTPLWKQLGQHKDAPLILRGQELEEITPDTNSGAYYKYLLDRVLLLTEYKGQNVLISLCIQKGNSEVGKKAATIGEYDDWDFVYSGVSGTNLTLAGSADTFIYSSASLIVFYEDAPGSKFTGYAMYRWMSAGWGGMNMVKDHHIATGAERSFAGIRAFMESGKRPSAKVIASYVSSLNALDLPALQERFKPYSVKVEEAASKVSLLKNADFQNVVKDAGYGNSLTKEEIVAAMSVNFIKQKLGKPLLAGPLDGKGATRPESGATAPEKSNAVEPSAPADPAPAAK